jgi:hypothetical protein
LGCKSKSGSRAEGDIPLRGQARGQIAVYARFPPRQQGYSLGKVYHFNRSILKRRSKLSEDSHQT